MATTYLFTYCEYGGGEISSCTVTCDEDFADGFARGLSLRIDEETHYIVCEELREDDAVGFAADLEPWVEAA